MFSSLLPLCWHFFLPTSLNSQSFLLCYAFSSQCSLQSDAENNYKLCIVLSFIVIMCIFLFKSRPIPSHGQSIGQNTLSFSSISFPLCKDFSSPIQRWANSELTIIEHRLKVFMGGVTISMSYLTFVAAEPLYVSICSSCNSCVLNYMIKQSC